MNEQLSFTMPDGTALYLTRLMAHREAVQAGDKQGVDLSGVVNNNYILTGDLNCMGVMEQTLLEAKFPVERTHCGTYPGFELLPDFVGALQVLFAYQIPGWWNQRVALIKHGVCSEADFDAAFAGGNEWVKHRLSHDVGDIVCAVFSQ